MTREEAIEVIKEYRDSLIISPSNQLDGDVKALDMAIQALSQEPTEKPMTVDEMEREYEKSKALFHKIVECDDAISRILKRMWNCRGKHTTSIDKVKMEQIIRDELSVTQKSGKWIGVNPMVDTLMCSECGENIISADFKSNYCPNCGAKMESEDKE